MSADGDAGPPKSIGWQTLPVATMSYHIVSRLETGSHTGASHALTAAYQKAGTQPGRNASSRQASGKMRVRDGSMLTSVLQCGCGGLPDMRMRTVSSPAARSTS